MASKIIVTNKMALEAKYGKTGSDSVLLTLNTMVAMDRQIRNISSFVLLLDDKNQMSLYGAKNVTDPQDEKQVKEAIDKICKNIKPDYILLLGGRDIIPHQHLVHPGDPRKQVESDLPYACSTAYHTSVDAYLQPERMVSRLPDTTKNTEGADETKFVKVILDACRQNTRAQKDYEKCFAVSAADFKSFGQKNIKEWFGDSQEMECCPPHNHVWSREQYDCLIHYFALYGFSGQFQWFEDKEGKKAAFDCGNENMHLENGTVVISQCSYGAQLFEFVRKQPICNVYMENKACAFLGCTGECSPGREGNKEDGLIAEFLTQIKNGKSIGEAFLNARKGLITDPQHASPEEKLVLAQWVLYGDACIKPMS